MEIYKAHVVMGFYKGLLSEDLLSSQLGYGVIINRSTEYEYIEVSTGDPEETIEVVKQYLNLIHNGKVQERFELDETDIEEIDTNIDILMEAGYEHYITEKALLNLLFH